MKKWLVKLGLLALAGALGAAWGSFSFFRPKPVTQPIAFNHKKHLAEDISCKDCHQHVEEGVHATLPAVKACLLCHEEAKGSHPDEPKVRDYAKENREIPWIQVNRMVGHVYFSHSAHVKYAEMDCKECHGDMKEKEEAVTVSQVEHLTMGRCMACHEEKGVSNDCLGCHK
ncbi:MAG: cytochrome c3 family protein [Planctomycetes bacterium]|nr:cytochrome c3 family protein [Planctomycetota bacterium]